MRTGHGSALVPDCGIRLWQGYNSGRRALWSEHPAGTFLKNRLQDLKVLCEHGRWDYLCSFGYALAHCLRHHWFHLRKWCIFQFHLKEVWAAQVRQNKYQDSRQDLPACHAVRMTWPAQCLKEDGRCGEVPLYLERLRSQVVWEILPQELRRRKKSAPF